MDSAHLSCPLDGAFVLRGREATRTQLLSMYGCVKRRHGAIYGHSPGQFKTPGGREEAHNVLRVEEKFQLWPQFFCWSKYYLCTDATNSDGGKMNVIRIIGSPCCWHSDPCWPTMGPDHTNTGSFQQAQGSFGLVPADPLFRVER